MRALLLSVLLTAAAFPLHAQNAAEPDSFSFVVLGHVRGGENGKFNYMMDEIIEEVQRVRPDLVFLTGDMIWGDVHAVGMSDSLALRRDWEALDSIMGQLGVPVYRVPGNHDLHDPASRDLFIARYGRLPRAVDFRGSRFLLLSSAYIPPGDSIPDRKLHIRPAQLASAQQELVTEALADTAEYNHAFLFMHHMLWWDEGAPWWRDVHPSLVGRKVDAVFAGDYGPMKFSHLERDGIDYLQTSVEGFPTIRILQNLVSSRLLYQQFDNFLHVKVEGPEVSVDVRTVGAISGAKFTPQRWREINAIPPRSVWERLRAAVASPKRIAALIVLSGGAFVAGVLSTLVWTRRRRRPEAPVTTGT